MSQTRLGKWAGSSRPDLDRAPKTSLSAISAKVIMATTMSLSLAALWSVTSFGIGEFTWLLALLLTVAIRMPHSRRNAGNAIVAYSASQSTPVVFLMLIAIMVLPLIFLAGWVPVVLNYHLRHGLKHLGLALQLPSLWLFHRSHADLVRNRSPGLEIRQGRELVRAGVYRRVRHPIYVAVAISAIAQPFLLQNWLAGPPAMIAAAVFLALCVPAEENMTACHFGDAYRSYRAVTGHFFPWFRRGRSF